MYVEDIWKKYNMVEEEKAPFAKFIQSSSYKHTKSLWSGLNIDDGEDIDAIVKEFRKGYTRRFIPLSEFSSSVVENATPQFYGVKRISTKRVFGNASTFISRVAVMNDQDSKTTDASILACGITRDRAELLLKYLVNHGGVGELVVDTQCTQEHKKVTWLIDSTINPRARRTCPRCYSTDVTIGKRGYNVVFGLVGSSKTINRCGKCGHTWNADWLMK